MSTTRPDTAPVDLVWPEQLILPSRPPRLIYLDLNHWIGLARAAAGRPDGARYAGLLAALDAAMNTGQARVVLTGSLFWEISKNEDPRQRLAYADIIDRLTNFEYLCGLPDLMKLELTSVLDELTGTTGLSWLPTSLIGPGVLSAFGMAGNIQIFQGDTDVTAEATQSGIDVAALQRRGERMFIEGPAAFDMDDLRQRGHRPDVANQSVTGNIAIEQYFADHQLDEHWRRGRLRDILLARDLSLELLDALILEGNARNLTVSDMVGSRQQGRRLVLGMPTRCVVVEMKTGYHRNAQKRWSVNDLHDIDALANAVPYCDVVFTDAAARRCLLQAGLDERMQTFLPRTPDECAEAL